MNTKSINLDLFYNLLCNWQHQYTDVLFAGRTNCTHQALGRRPTLAHYGFIPDWPSCLL